MVSILQQDLLREIDLQVPCRQRQLQQLAIYYNHHLPSPPVLVAHGLEHTSKVEAIVTLLETSKIRHALVRSRDCLSQRHLLTKIFATCIRRLDESAPSNRYDRIDGLNSLVVSLSKLFEGRSEKFVLIIDGVDKQRGMSSTLLPTLARLGDTVENLSVILTFTSSQSIPLHRAGVPYIHFPPYSRVEAISIVQKQQIPMPERLPEDCPDIVEDQIAQIHRSFVTIVYDTLTSHTSSTSLQSYQKTCERLWPQFIWPLLSGEAPPSKSMYNHSSNNVKWDFARLLARNRSLFQLQGEKALLTRLTSDPSDAWSFDQLISQHNRQGTGAQLDHLASEPKQETPLLKSFATLLLVSSYLASHTPPKHDIILFSRLSSSSTNKRKYLSSALSKSRTGGVRKTPTKKRAAAGETNGTAGDETPSKKRKSGEENGEGLAGEKTPKSTRLLLEKTSNIPRPFTLERVIAILRAVHPDGLPRTRGAADKVYAEMAELERLRLVVRCVGGAGGEASGTRGGGGGGDDGILEEKWRINVGREFVVGLGAYWDMSLEGWEIE